MPEARDALNALLPSQRGQLHSIFLKINFTRVLIALAELANGLLSGRPNFLFPLSTITSHVGFSFKLFLRYS